MYKTPRFLPVGDSAVSIEFGDSIDPETNGAVRNLVVSLEQNMLDGVIDLVPSYRSLLVNYNPMSVQLPLLIDSIVGLLSREFEGVIHNAKVIEIPTLYGGEAGPDLDFVCTHNDLTSDEVIRIHSTPRYLVYMLGFSPGFPYLGGMPPSIETPRLDTPRIVIPAGSVGIAEKQTGIYPTAGPGGWRLIGKTPLAFFDPSRDPPCLLNPGDYLKFISIEEEQYYEIAHQIKAGTYSHRREVGSE